MQCSKLVGIASRCLILLISFVSVAEASSAEYGLISTYEPAIEINPALTNGNFSWDDALLQKALWRGKKQKQEPGVNQAHWKIGKRSPRPGGTPLINIPCLSCAEPASSELDGDLAGLTAQKMVTLIKSSSGAASGSCLFYGQRPSNIWKSGGGARSLSAATTSFACSTFRHAYRTIWMLWPYQSDNDAKPYSNYYCLNPWSPVESCWLNGFFTGVKDDNDARKQAALPYFRAMSKAMALTCRGEVFIAADDPARITEQFPDEPTKSIWLTHELPTLQYMYQKLNLVSKLTVLTVSQDAVTDSTLTDRTDALQAPIPAGYSYTDGGNTKRMMRFLMERFAQLEEERRAAGNDTHWLEKRDCTSPVNFEGDQQDNFG